MRHDDADICAKARAFGAGAATGVWAFGDGDGDALGYPPLDAGAWAARSQMSKRRYAMTTTDQPTDRPDTHVRMNGGVNITGSISR